MRRLFALALLACSSQAPSAPPSPPPPLPSPAPPPPYDLAADRARVSDLARAELGAAARVQIAQDVFVLVAAPGWNERALAASTDLTTRAIDAYYNHRFAKKPAQPIGVYLFPDRASYQAYCRAKLGGACESPFGMYHPSIRRIVMNAGSGLGTLTHELVHPIVEADFPNAPTWVNEGIASLYEAPVIPKAGEVHGVKNWRWPRLMTGMKRDDEKNDARLDALFGMSDEAFRREPLERLHYATARYVMQWLDQKGWLWTFYRAYRDGFEDDKTGAKAFARATGMTPAAANAAWTAWVKAL